MLGSDQTRYLLFKFLCNVPFVEVVAPNHLCQGVPVQPERESERSALV